MRCILRTGKKGVEGIGGGPLQKNLKHTVQSAPRDEAQTQRHLPSRAYLGLFAALLLLAGMALLFLVRVPKAIASLTWPTTEGVVISSRVVETGPATDVSWYPHVSYRYSANGKEYTSQAIEVIVVANGNTDFQARRVTERYPAGKRVQVHYDLDNPAVALLEAGVPDNDVSTSFLFFAGIAGAFVLLCVGLPWVWAVVAWN